MVVRLLVSCREVMGLIPRRVGWSTQQIFVINPKGHLTPHDWSNPNLNNQLNCAICPHTVMSNVST